MRSTSRTCRPNAETWENVVRKLRVGAMPPHGVRRPDQKTTDSLIAWLEGELDRTQRALARPAGSETAQSRRICQRDSRSARARCRCRRAAAARRVSLRLRQRLGCAGQLAGAAAGVSGRGAQDQRVRRRRSAHRDRQRHLFGAAGSLAGRAPRGPAARHGRRHARQAHVSGRWRIRVPGQALSHEPERDSWPRGSTRPRADAGRRADSSRVDWRREGSDRAADESDRHVRRARASRLRVRRVVKAGQRDVAAAFLDATPPLFETNRLQRFIRDFSNPFDAEGAPHVQSITIQGPFGAKTAGTPPSPRVFICRPAP